MTGGSGPGVMPSRRVVERGDSVVGHIPRWRSLPHAAPNPPPGVLLVNGGGAIAPPEPPRVRVRRKARGVLLRDGDIGPEGSSLPVPLHTAVGRRDQLHLESSGERSSILQGPRDALKAPSEANKPG